MTGIVVTFAFMELRLEQLGNFTDKLWNSSTQGFGRILNVVDDVAVAIFVILLGWFLGSWVKKGILHLGDKLKLTHVSDKVGFTRLLAKANVKASPAKVIGELAKGYIVTIFPIGAANILGFTQISEFLDAVIGYIPNVLIALAIVLLGTNVANTTSAILENTLKLAHSRAAKTMGITAKYIIATFAILAALFQLKIAEDLVRILFFGFIALITIAGGLAFGLGGKEVVQEFLEDVKNAPKTTAKRAGKAS